MNAWMCIAEANGDLALHCPKFLNVCCCKCVIGTFVVLSKEKKCLCYGTHSFEIWHLTVECSCLLGKHLTGKLGLCLSSCGGTKVLLFNVYLMPIFFKSIGCTMTRIAPQRKIKLFEFEKFYCVSHIHSAL